MLFFGQIFAINLVSIFEFLPLIGDWWATNYQKSLKLFQARDVIESGLWRLNKHSFQEKDPIYFHSFNITEKGSPYLAYHF